MARETVVAGARGATTRGGGMVLAEPEPLPERPRPTPLLALPAAQVRSGPLLAAGLPLLQAGRRIYCLDGANSFDPWRLAALARRQGADPAAMLERVFVSRAFTCHQLVEAALTLLPPLLATGPAAVQSAPIDQTVAQLPTLAGPVSHGMPLVVILGIDRLFLEDEIALGERQRLFDRLLKAVAGLHRRGLPLLITFGAEAESPWAHALGRIAPRFDGPAPLRRALAGLRRQLTRPF